MDYLAEKIEKKEEMWKNNRTINTLKRKKKTSEDYENPLNNICATQVAHMWAPNYEKSYV